MSREIDLLSREYSKKSCSVLRKDLNLYGKNLPIEFQQFARDVERIAKKEKQGSLVLIAILSD